MRSLCRPVLHPMLVAVYPFLFLYSTNPGQLPFPWLATGLATAVTVIGALALTLVFHDRYKGGLSATLILGLVYFYGHIFDGMRELLGGHELFGIEVLRHRYLLIAYAAPFVMAFLYIWKTKADLRGFNEAVTAVAVLAVLIPLVQLGFFRLRTTRVSFPADLSMPAGGITTGGGKSVSVKLLPNIYYIIVDGRASSEVLRDYFGYSDADFTNYLRSKGFYIASKSHSNYAMTFLSLASSLNMEFLDYLTPVLGSSSRDESVPRWLIANNKVGRFVKSRGYHFLNISSGWGPTNWLSSADTNVNVGDPFSEFYDTFLQTTILRPMVISKAQLKARRRIAASFQGLLEFDKAARPTFVFAHILAPHPPFVFRRNGEPVTTPQPKIELFGTAWKRKDEYIDQLVFTDRMVTTVIDRILAESDVPPIILIQSDHGSASTPSPADLSETFSLKERMSIFNAYHLPGFDKRALYESISPVNSFRLMFNHYFKTKFPLLKDQVYFSRVSRPFEFVDVTAKLLGEDTAK